MEKKYISAAVYSAAHFAVDFSCAFIMFRFVRPEDDWMLCLLIYNFFAFAMQMPTGLLADRINRNSAVAALGCIFAAAAYCLVSVPAVLSAAAGLGNAMFHVGGGLDVLNMSGKKAGLLGVFVSPGAFGIYFGMLAGKSGSVGMLIRIALLLLFTVLIMLLHYRAGRGAESDNAPFAMPSPAGGALIAALAFLIVVCFRSYAGFIMSFPWKTGAWAVVFVCGVVFGKAAGGFLSDRFGAAATSVISLALSAALFCFSGNPVCGVLSVFLFNMTMPITLWATARLLPGAKGFAFGLLTFGLFLGFLPVYFGVDIPWNKAVTFGAVCALSIVLILTGLKKVRE